MSELKLEPCPGCGKSDLDQWPNESLDASGANVIRCAWCHFAAPLKAWNRRTPQSVTPAGGEVGRVLGLIRMAADAGGATEGQCYGWWRDLNSCLAHPPAADAALVEAIKHARVMIDHFMHGEEGPDALVSAYDRLDDSLNQRGGGSNG